MRILFILFGCLDLLAFYRSFGTLSRTLESFDTLLIPFGIPALTVLLMLSLLISGPLMIVENRAALTIYFFQFPLRLAFSVGLSFGFVFRLFNLQVGTFGYGMLMATVFGLEAVRLMITLQAFKAGR